MKLKFILIAVTLSLLADSLNSQNLITVQNGGEPEFYLQVDDAIINSFDGDTIYIPGGSWNITQPINNRLHLIGVGYHPDSTHATFQTTLIGNLQLQAGSSYSSVTGIYLNGSIYNIDNPVIFFTASRCHFSNGITLNQLCSDFAFYENIIDGYLTVNSDPDTLFNFSFFNNIINAIFSNNQRAVFFNSVFRNNVFLNGTSCFYGCYPCIICSFSVIENNVFKGISSGYGASLLSGASNSIFNNNLFVEGITFPLATNVGSNNLSVQDPNSIFINGYLAILECDYHLQSNCPGKNSGTDGTDIGIYGGSFPWKEGSIPFNPHFQSVSIPGTTDQNGNLNVNIKVAAQDH